MSASIIELMELYDEYLLEQQLITREQAARGEASIADSFGGFMTWLKRRVKA